MAMTDIGLHVKRDNDEVGQPDVRVLPGTGPELYGMGRAVPKVEGPAILDDLANAGCELRSKQYYLHGGLATEPEHILDATGHCWCFVTQQVVGPYGARVGPGRCVPGRACYTSVFQT